MRRLRTLGAAVAATTLAATALAGTAAAQPQASAQVLGPVVLNDDGTATVRARYLCYASNHLWVSAKQSADGRPDERLQEPGSSQHAEAWMQSHPANFECDGRKRTGTFTIRTTNWGPGLQWEALQQGQAWVQFCLVDTVGESEFVTDERWAAVRER